MSPIEKASLVLDLTDVVEWLSDQIDGAEESRGRDSTISTHIRTVSRAIVELGGSE